MQRGTSTIVTKSNDEIKEETAESEDRVVTSADGKHSMHVAIIDNVMFLPFFKKQVFDYLRQSYNSAANDVFIASYPKCGTTWCIKICVQIMHFVEKNQAVPNSFYEGNGNLILLYLFCTIKITFFFFYQKKKKKKDPLLDRYEWSTRRLSSENPEKWDKFFTSDKEHITPWYLFPCHKIHRESKLIIAIREPKDTLVSGYYFWSKTPIHLKSSLHQYVEWFAEGNVPWGNYFRWYRGYYEQYNCAFSSPSNTNMTMTAGKTEMMDGNDDGSNDKGNDNDGGEIMTSDSRISIRSKSCKQGMYSKQFAMDNVLWIYYEDLQHNLKQQIIRIATFLGVLEILDSKDLEEIERACQLEAMKSSALQEDFDQWKYLFRKGEIGDWKNHLDLHDRLRIDRLCRSWFRSTPLRHRSWNIQPLPNF
ncbi:sulfotransferase family 2A member 1 family member [Reticulomyxa filosa]|uniref:Sulfotransferase family 2A member 1 family member n=1 Tax=Reticulomyxa filosa TaxID=46433 RepID=X6P003_RETFI|nr:sulfotransferase family 2A member 1 family member [Reticulomyxa filosa]|eukprot:ETO31880.1 sulfotransferase family 2A member 1 family member [Reticulomyxa filosa]